MGAPFEGSVEHSEANLRFAAGTLELSGELGELASELPADLVWDPRTGSHRAPAYRYAETVLALHGRCNLVDEARRYAPLPQGARVLRSPRPFQTAALDAWVAARGRGVVVLPTGAGKSHLAMMAIDSKRRATLVVVPTLDLMRQWYDLLRTTFGTTVGLVGGGALG